MCKPQARSIPGGIHQNNQHCCNATKTLYKDGSLYNLSPQCIGVPQMLKPSRDRESHFTGLSDSYGQNSPNNRGGETFDFRLQNFSRLVAGNFWGSVELVKLWVLGKNPRPNLPILFKENRTPASCEVLIYPLQRYCSPSERWFTRLIFRRGIR